MALQIGADDEDAALSQINTTPLVDVMLVLLIIFLITIPVVTTAVPLKLPVEKVEQRQSKPENILISVDREGRMYWFNVPLRGTDDLLRRLEPLARRPVQPEIQIRGDETARYEGVGRVLYACQRAGIEKISFVTTPVAPES